jgi:hypothetical protein
MVGPNGLEPSISSSYVADRFIRAVERLGATTLTGSKKMETRIGAIYALARIAAESESDHWSVLEVLTAYIQTRP